MLGQVDFSKANASELFTRSLVETGFAVLVNHPIELKLIQNTYRDWADFFASDSRWDYIFDSKTQTGYVPPNISEKAKGYDFKDLKEFFNIYDPEKCPSMTRAHTAEIRQKMLKVADTLLGWIEQHMPHEMRLKLSESLTRMVEGSRQHLLRPIHYPPLIGTETQGAVRSAAHEDINLLTVLPAGTAPGLQVKDIRGVWHEVDCGPGDLVINSGEMLDIATERFYPATTHQVVNPAGDAAKLPRYSMPFFMHPRPEVMLTQTRTAGEFLETRLKELGLR